MLDFEFGFYLLGGQEGYRRCVGERDGELALGVGGPKVYCKVRVKIMIDFCVTTVQLVERRDRSEKGLLAVKVVKKT